MGIIGFNKTKIHAELKQAITGKINIANNVAIKNIEESKIQMGKNSQDVLKFSFEFFTKYIVDEKIESAIINIEGNVIFIDEPSVLKKYLASWKKDKKIPKEVMTQVLNLVLTKCNIESLKISEQFNLPPPIPLPKVNIENNKQKTTQSYIG